MVNLSVRTNHKVCWTLYVSQAPSARLCSFTLHEVLCFYIDNWGQIVVTVRRNALYVPHSTVMGVFLQGIKRIPPGCHMLAARWRGSSLHCLWWWLWTHTDILSSRANEKDGGQVYGERAQGGIGRQCLLLHCWGYRNTVSQKVLGNLESWVPGSVWLLECCLTFPKYWLSLTLRFCCWAGMQMLLTLGSCDVYEEVVSAGILIIPFSLQVLKSS